MPRNESARVRAERQARIAQKEKEAQAQAQTQAQQLEAEVPGYVVDNANDDVEMLNASVAVKKEANGDQSSIGTPREGSPFSQTVVQRPRVRRHNRVTDRTRKPMNKWQEDKFDREIRWLFFLNLRHENEGTKEAVIKAVNPTIDPLSYQYEDLWRAIMGKVNHLRGHTTNYLKAHVTDMIKLDANNNGNLASLKTHAELAGFFQKIYSVSKFLEVFFFVSSIVDLRNQSPLALYYTKSLYANACAKTKLHLDWLKTEKAYNDAVERKKRQERQAAAETANTAAARYEDVAVGSDDLFVAQTDDGTNTVTSETARMTISPEKAIPVPAAQAEEIVIPPFEKMSPHNREALVVYLNHFPLAPQFAEVSRKEFTEKQAKRVKKPKAEPTHIAVGLDNMFFDSEPPKPSAR